jgi:hypothetical protein
VVTRDQRGDGEHLVREKTMGWPGAGFKSQPCRRRGAAAVVLALPGVIDNALTQL